MTAGADKPSAKTAPLEPQVSALNLSSADLVALAVSQKPPAKGEAAVTPPAGTTASDVGPPAVVSTQSRRSGVAAMELNSPNPQAPKIINPDGTTTDATPHWNINNTNPAAAAEVQQAEANRARQQALGLNPNGTNNAGSDGLAAANPEAARLASQQAQLADPHSDLNAAIRLRAPLNNPYGYSPGWEQFFEQPVVGALAGFAAGGPIPYLMAKAANKVDSSRRNPYETIMETGHSSTYANLSNQLRTEHTATTDQIAALEARSLRGDEAHRFDMLTARTDAMDILCPTQASAENRLDAVKAASAEAETRMGKDFALFTPEEFELLHSRIKTPPSAMQDHWSSEIEQFAQADRNELARYEALQAAGGSSDPQGLANKIDRLKTREQVLQQLDTTPQAMARRAEQMPPGLLTADELEIAKQAGSTDVQEVRQAVEHMRQLQTADHTELSALEARFSRADRDELARLTQRRDALAGVLPEQGRSSAELKTAAQTALDRNAAAGGRLLSADEARLIKEQAEALEKLKPTQRGDRARAWFGNMVREQMLNQTPLSQRLASEQATFYSAHQSVQGFVNADAQTLRDRDAAARARTSTPDVTTVNAETIERDRLRQRTEIFTAGTGPSGKVNPVEMEQALATAKGEKRALFAETEIAAMEARLAATRSVALTERQLTPSFWSAMNPEVGKRPYFSGPVGNAAKGALAVTAVDAGESYLNSLAFHDNNHNGLGSLVNAGIVTPLLVGNMFHRKEQTEGNRGNLATRKWAQFGALPLLAWGAGKGIDAFLPGGANPDQYSAERAALTPTALSNGIVAGAATLPLRPGLRWKVETAAVLGSMAINYLTNSGDDHYRQAHAADDATKADQREKSGSSMTNAIDAWEVIGNARSQYIADKVQVFGYQHGKDTGPQILDDRRASVIMRTALGEVQLAKGFSNANAQNSDPNYRDEGFSGNPLQVFSRSFDRRDSTQQIQDANHILAGLNLDLGSQALTNFQTSLANIQKLEAADGSQTSGLAGTKARINKNLEKIYGAHDIPKVVDGLITWIQQGKNGKDAEVEREAIGNQIQAQEQAIQQGQAVDQRALAKECRDYALISVALAKGNTAAGATDAAGFSRDVNNYLAKSQQYYPQDNADILAIQQINSAAAARGSLNQQNSSGSPLKGL